MARYVVYLPVLDWGWVVIGTLVIIAVLFLPWVPLGFGGVEMCDTSLTALRRYFQFSCPVFSHEGLSSDGEAWGFSY